MPSLPQTKHCPLCPARFTRTTHLNRHLRSHTNERLHRCNTCHAEFTRSDLLTRHKRTCGDANANRSRRKSCQACAESKVKCNLQYPCSKCTSRGRECVFINDPEVSRNKKNASKKASSLSSSSKLSAENDNTAISPSRTFSSVNTSVEYSPSSISPDLTTSPVSELSSVQMTPSDVPTLSISSGASSASSSQSSPRSEFLDSRQDMSVAFDMSFDPLAFDTHLDRIFSNNALEPFLDSQMVTCSPIADPGDFPWLDGNEMFARYGDETFMFAQAGYDDQGFATGYVGLTSADTMSPRMSAPLAEIDSAQDTFYDLSSAVNPFEITTAELDQYLYLFFTAFCTQVPLVHSSSWKMEDKPHLLVRAMQACGALFVKTERANNFISETLASARDPLIQEFTKITSSPREQAHLILTAVLLQTIGLFHQKPEERVSSSVYHGMLVMMIRRNGIIGRVGAWAAVDLSSPEAVEISWREWACYETIKRALFLSYIHDCCHCMYFSLTPSFQPSELDINLPCDTALWTATNSKDWFEIVQAPSAYGTGHARISGVRMQHALAALGETQPQLVPLSLNMFAHFILIHTILRNICAPRDDASYANLPDPSLAAADGAAGRVTMKDNLLATQYALHNWLQMWLNSPESMQAEKCQEEPPFIFNALPFYWLAQVSLMAIQDGTTIFHRKPDMKADGRFRLMKEWLDHIKSFLRGGNEVPTHFWDQLMKIRGHTSQDEAPAGDEDPNGLLAFFPS